ncbi:MAG: serine hydrolase family protein [Methylobacteriaceae bacterium]|nr:serine hydrolase family protein [Methylobacteriaceae bacterium]
MKAADADLLFIPGRAGPDADHWQSRWRQRLSTARFVDLPDWSGEALAPARAELIAAVRRAVRPAVLIAHAEGVGLVARAAADLAPAGLAGRVAGAFLVAPAGATEAPRDPLPFPSLMAASRNDPACDFAVAGDLALAWGSALADAGEAGGLDAASGHGPWPEGLMRLAGFLAKL